MKDEALIFRLYRMLRELEHEAGLDELDLRARALLRLICEGDASGTPPIVGDFVKENPLGTPPTIFSSLAELQSAGWIERLPDKQDGRARRLTLTPQARRVFARMSKRLSLALKPDEP